ncbi:MULTISPECIES: LCP family protein [unclassified Arthrobacter]|uniref:LCP family protein n=1 Tax=unclassified Arthrobacter TaxID=235627 RepID=UPI00159D4A2A|nr:MULTISPECIES: LCP family protein [unclassified Arthrobacter]MCQ9163840.1 LCP family protein [Arthrobacter sp. STN4]NVM99992.1 LCP family protein [Arthrobacter sp. SDTb3-6]
MGLYEQLILRDRRRLRRRRITLAVLAAVVAAVMVAVAFVVATVVQANDNILRSRALDGAQSVAKLTKDTNILVMGLDSRVDEKGKPLSAAVYSALDAGNQSTGGYNANVLMLVHIPADGSKATAMSIPRDDYVHLAGIPGQDLHAKIKEAYGYGLAAEQTALLAAGKPNDQATYQQAREAGRRAEIATVSQFLGSVHIDHFVEVTMAGFYEVAQAVAPITVCVNQATQDTYSGANFVKGVQQINAKQAMAFVRQRRDTTNPNYSFTDLDRERRQQAFIVSVIHQLKQAGTFTDIPKMQSVLSAVSSNLVVDSGLNLLDMARQAGAITSGNISFTTLPITGFGTSPTGESINTVDVAQVQATVKELLSPARKPAAKAATPGHSKPAGSASSGSGASHGSGSPSGSAANAPSSGTAPKAAKTPATTTYSDWTGALQGGSVTCVK